MRWKLPRETIRWITGRFHVSVKDDEVEADIRHRFASLIQPGSKRPTAKQIDACVRYALKCHAANRKLFYDIARGNLR